MAEIIRMPRLSDTMEEGNIVGWLKAVGDSVELGDVLAEVETDKATMELESYHEGVLLYVGVKEGPIAVDGIIAVIGKEGEDFKSQLESAMGTNGTSSDQEIEDVGDTSVKEESIALVKPDVSTGVNAPAKISKSSASRLKASPLAKKMASEAGISLDRVKGTGEMGRIVKRDIEMAITTSENEGFTEVESTFEYGTFPISQMRKIIARRLGESKFQAPHFYLTIEIDLDNVIIARKAINENPDIRISFNDFIVKAAAMALRVHPDVNASWNGDSITYHRDINIGVAVAVDEGLLVPVLDHADKIGLARINSSVRSLAKKAKSKKLQPEEMQGNTFTISNLGMFGIEEFTAIINPPDACIMAVGSIVKKPVIKDGVIEVGNRMKVTLSCDHRVVDGAVGARFLSTFRSMLENPVMMIV